MSASAKPSVRAVEETAVSRRTQARATQKTDAAVDPRFADIASNTFYAILHDESTDLEQAQAKIKEATRFESEAKSRQLQAELALYKEYLQDARERMNVRIIELTNTDTFAELQAVIEDMNASMLDFEGKMEPMTRLIKAIHNIRNQGSGKLFETYKEIEADRQFETEKQAEIDRLGGDIRNIDDQIRRLEDEAIAHDQERSWGGWGGQPVSAKTAAAQKRAEAERLRGERTAKETQYKQAQFDLEARRNAVGSEDKARLRELLDLTGEQHRERSKDLNESALNFIKTSKERTTSVRTQIEGMNGQWTNLFDVNNKISKLYAALGEGLSDSEKENLAMREQFSKPEGEEESMVKRQLREEKKIAIERHIEAMTEAKQDTMTTYADLATGAVRIKSLLDANNQQKNRITTLQTRGVAGMADRLATAINSIAQAALNESNAAATDTIARMNELTNELSRDQVMSNALGLKEGNNELLRAIEDLAKMHDAVDEATDVASVTVTEAREYLTELKKMTKDMNDSLGKNFAVHADAALGETAAPTRKEAAPAAADPFKL